MRASASIGSVRVDMSMDEAIAISRFLKARREGGLMVSTDSLVVNALETKLVESAAKAYEFIMPHISEAEVAELNRDFIQAMCPNVVIPTPEERKAKAKKFAEGLQKIADTDLEQIKVVTN